MEIEYIITTLNELTARVIVIGKKIDAIQTELAAVSEAVSGE